MNVNDLINMHYGPAIPEMMRVSATQFANLVWNAAIEEAAVKAGRMVNGKSIAAAIRKMKR